MYFMDNDKHDHNWRDSFRNKSDTSGIRIKIKSASKLSNTPVLLKELHSIKLNMSYIIEIDVANF